jgi:hypothetical protein
MAPEEPDVADELAYMATHPTQFTKTEMVAMMLVAAERLRKQQEALAKARAGVMEAVGHLNQLPRKGNG